MKKLKILTTIYFGFLIFTYSFSNNFKIAKALEKKTNLVETKKNNNLSNIQKITLKIPEKDVFIKGLTVVSIEDKLLKSFLEKLKITAELNEQKSSFFDMISTKKNNFKNSDGIYITFALYEKDPLKKEKIFEKTNNFLNTKFEQKLKKLELSEKDVEEYLVKLGFFLNAEYQATKSYFLNLKNEKKQRLKNNLSDIKLAFKNKDKILKILELFDKEFFIALKNELENNKNLEENLIKNYEKEFSANLEKETKETFQKNKENLKEFLKFISGIENVEKIFKEYEKSEKQDSKNSNSLEKFFKNLFKSNKKREQIIENLKKCIKNTKLKGLKEEQIENKALKNYEVIDKLSFILKSLLDKTNYDKLEGFLKNKKNQEKFKNKIEYIKNLILKITKAKFSKKLEKNEEYIFQKDLNKLEKFLLN